MNYIRHLNAFFSFVRSDDRLACSHVSLYLALFQYWNFNRFQNPFPVYRDNLMNLSKIGSKNTYHKCIKELHEAKYIYYQPTASKFLPVRISVIRLDIQEELPTRYKQLDLFGDEKGNPACPKNDTDSVPNLGLTSTDFDTGTVPKMGHNIKPNFKKNKTVYDTPTENFKNENPGKENGNLHSVPKPVHNTERSRSVVNPTLSEVEECFRENNYPADEASKFFLYNQGKGWMITDKLAIKDWKALVHKWMLNPKKLGHKQEPAVPVPNNNIQNLYKSFLEGKKIFKFLTTDHFIQLNLQLTEQIMHDAWQERKNQLSGTNQYSINQLLQAYEEGNKNSQLIQQDQPNLIALAKRIAVIRHFQQQQHDGATSLNIDHNKNQET